MSDVDPALELARQRSLRAFEILTIHLDEGPHGSDVALLTRMVREVGLDFRDPQDVGMFTMGRLASVLLHLVCAHGLDDHACNLTPSKLLAAYATKTAELRG